MADTERPFAVEDAGADVLSAGLTLGETSLGIEGGFRSLVRRVCCGKAWVCLLMRECSLSTVFSLRSYRGVWRVAVILAVLQAGYAGWFIYRSSFLVEGQRFFCLFDDAMISMRYAANWADGHGLVWNPGERVEGYTNFGWTAIMGLCHLLGLTPSHTCLVIQLLGIPVLWGCLAGTLLLAKSCRLVPVVACGAMMLAVAQWNLNFFTLVGMESGLLTLMVTFALRESVLAIRKREGRVAPMLWFAGALLIRPDALILLLFSAVFLLVAAPRKRSRTIVGLVIVAVVMSAHLLWRHHFYGDWFPNTYYLKATGWALADRLPAGVRTGVWTAVTLGLPFLVGLASVSRPRSWQVLLSGAFLLSFAYEVYVGGDAWPKHYRFVLPTTFGLMVFAAQGIYRISRTFSSARSQRGFRLVLTLMVLLVNNSLHRDHWLLRLPPPGTLANQTSVRYALAAGSVAKPDATAAVTWAGAFPYFSRRRCFDLLGKCDPHIARLPAHTRVKTAGHNKFDPEWTLSTYKPDLVVDGLRIMDPGFIKVYRPVQVEVDGAALMFSVRRDSVKITGGKRVTWDVGRRVFVNTPRF